MRSGHFFGVEDALLGMDLDLEVLGNEGIHPVIDHQHGAVCGIEHGEVKHRPEKILMFAKLLCPQLELLAPFFPVLGEVIIAIEEELELVIGIPGIPENTHQVHIELMQVSEICGMMVPDPPAHVIYNTQGVAAQKVFYFNKVYQVVEQGIFEGELCLFQNVILVKWKEFSKHRCYEFCKSNKKGLL